MAPVRVDQTDLQGNVLAGYGHGHAVFAMARVNEPAAGRAWLGELLDAGITTAYPFAGSRPGSTTNVAITHDGLRALGVPDRILLEFPTAYRHGMAARAVRIGDDGPDAPALWESGIRAGEPHVLVTVYADSEAELTERRGLLEARLGGDDGLSLVHEQVAGVLKDSEGAVVAREHFGFADGLAQPSIDAVAADDPSRKIGPTVRPGQGTPTRGGWRDLAPGEFVLGYPDEAGATAQQPPAPLRMSGSYMVVRKLRQNVALFRRFMLNAAGGDPDEAELLAAKVVGRWRDGTPLVLSPERPDPPVPADAEPPNDFRYGSDQHGLRCPIGAHIRRANPRDELGFGGRLTSRHRIIRRGMPYGPPIENPEYDDGLERGLMFVCYQADIERQFEVVQGRWLEDGDAFGLGRDRDFLLAADDPHGKMTIQGNPPRFLAPQRSFVVTRGGGYFFAPGIAALRALAEGLS